MQYAARDLVACLLGVIAGPAPLSRPENRSRRHVVGENAAGGGYGPLDDLRAVAQPSGLPACRWSAVPESERSEEDQRDDEEDDELRQPESMRQRTHHDLRPDSTSARTPPGLTIQQVRPFPYRWGLYTTAARPPASVSSGDVLSKKEKTMASHRFIKRRVCLDVRSRRARSRGHRMERARTRRRASRDRTVGDTGRRAGVGLHARRSLHPRQSHHLRRPRVDDRRAVSTSRSTRDSRRAPSRCARRRAPGGIRRR